MNEDLKACAMIMKVQLEPWATMPTRAHKTDAGLDLYAPDFYEVLPRGSVIIATGVHVEIPVGFGGFIKSKSGLNVKHDLTCDGVIDSGYTGEIVVKLYNNGGNDYFISRGDKIAQLVIVPIITPELEIVNSLEPTERGNGGFGSTGK